MTNATTEQLELARKIAADGYYPLRHADDVIYARTRVLSGDMDHTVQVQTALAAIIETTERAAKLVEKRSQDLQARAVDAARTATALRNQEHLK